MNLNAATSNQVPQMAQIATHFAGHMALRLVHDHLLRMDLTKYGKVLDSYVTDIYMKVIEIRKVSFQQLCTVMSICVITHVINVKVKRH